MTTTTIFFTDKTQLHLFPLNVTAKFQQLVQSLQYLLMSVSSNLTKKQLCQANGPSKGMNKSPRKQQKGNFPSDICISFAIRVTDRV